MRGNFGRGFGVLSGGNRSEDAGMVDALHALGLFATLYVVLLLMRFG